MPTIYLSEDQIEQVKRACNDYAFLGHKGDSAWTDEQQEELRCSIFEKLGIERNKTKYLSWHTKNCRCKGCKQLRDEKKAFYG